MIYTVFGPISYGRETTVDNTDYIIRRKTGYDQKNISLQGRYTTLNTRLQIHPDNGLHIRSAQGTNPHCAKQEPAVPLRVLPHQVIGALRAHTRVAAGQEHLLNLQKKR